MKKGSIVLVTEAGLAPARIDADGVDAFHATLQKIEQSRGSLPTRIVNVTLFDDGDHEDGAMERDGIWGDVLTDLTRYEGIYTFHARATFGDGCSAAREAFWSIAVEASIDPSKTTVETTAPVIRIVPRDVYGNPLGPGRRDRFEVFGVPGVTITGPVKDNGDGSYTVPSIWDPDTTPQPGVVVSQPGRPAVPLLPAPAKPSGCGPSIWIWIALALLIGIVVLLLILIMKY